MLPESPNCQISSCSDKQSENSRLKYRSPLPDMWLTGTQQALLFYWPYWCCKLSILIGWLGGKNWARWGSSWWNQKTQSDGGSWRKLSHKEFQLRLQLVKKQRVWHPDVKRWQQGNDFWSSASEAFILQRTLVDSSVLSRAKGAFRFWRS